MNLEAKYKDDYILLAGLREYVENGTMLASVNFWRDELQRLPEFRAVDHRKILLNTSPEYSENEFLVAFVGEQFPEFEQHISDSILELVFPIIESNEGKDTLKLTKKFLVDYATYIAKSSKEDWLAFIGLKDSISDKEEEFINQLREHLHLEE